MYNDIFNLLCTNKYRLKRMKVPCFPPPRKNPEVVLSTEKQRHFDRFCANFVCILVNIQRFYNYSQYTARFVLVFQTKLTTLWLKLGGLFGFLGTR